MSNYPTSIQFIFNDPNLGEAFLLFAKIGFDTAENESLRVCQKPVLQFYRSTQTRRRREERSDASLPLYHGAVKPFVDKINHYSESLVAFPQQTICVEGCLGRNMYLLVKGTVHVEKYGEIIETHPAPYSFGDLGCFSESNDKTEHAQFATYRAASQCYIRVVTWVANKRFEISKFKSKLPRARTYDTK